MNLLKTFTLAAALTACVSTAHAAPILGQGTWESTLLARDINGLAVDLNSASAAFFYDTTLNITWLRDFKAAIGAPQANATGQMTHPGALAWADSLTLGGYDDWRLTKVVDTGDPGCTNEVSNNGTNCGHNVATQGTVGGNTVYSELAHLFYVTLGNNAFIDTAGAMRQTGQYGAQNTAYFANMALVSTTPGFEGTFSQSQYWTGTTATVFENPQAFTFNFGSGFQTTLLSGPAFPGHEGNRLWAVAVRDGDVLRVSEVPEPGSLALALAGLVGLGAMARRQRRVAGRAVADKAH